MHQSPLPQQADTTAQHTPAAPLSAAVADSAHALRRVPRLEVDTVPPDPRQLKPLPAAEPLHAWPYAAASDTAVPSAFLAQPCQLARQLSAVSGREAQPTTLQLTGIEGEILPYRFRNDNVVTILLMVSFFLVVWIISLSRKYLQGSVSDFFHARPRHNWFAERTDTELRGQAFLVLQTCFVLSILLFDYTQNNFSAVCEVVSPYQLLLTYTALCLGYYLLKLALYAFVNSIFFSRESRERWTASYLLCILALGLGFLPVALLIVYFDLSFHHLLNTTLCLLAVQKCLLLYKCYSIFFTYKLGWVHLILYFCTLEITPLLAFGQVVMHTHRLLLTL